MKLQLMTMALMDDRETLAMLSGVIHLQVVLLVFQFKD